MIATLTATGLTGAITPLVVTSPSSDFGHLAAGTRSPPVTFTVTNPAGSSSGALATSITGMAPTEFRIEPGSDTCAGTTLAPTSAFRDVVIGATSTSPAFTLSNQAPGGNSVGVAAGGTGVVSWSTRLLR